MTGLNAGTAILWTIDSEYGRLREVLLSRPNTKFRYIPINAVAKQSIDRGETADAELALRQHAEFAAALLQADVAVHFLDQVEHLPLQPYTRDSSQTTPWGTIILPLVRTERRGEFVSILRKFEQEGRPIFDYVTHGTIEGGDIHIIRPGLLLIGSSGNRTTREGAEYFARPFQQAGWEVRIETFDEHFLHFDVLFCMAAEGLAVGCADALTDDFKAWLKAKKIRLVDASYADTMSMGCNILALGDGKVISPKENANVNTKLRAEGLDVLDPALSVLLKQGGSVHCMSMPLRRDLLA